MSRFLRRALLGAGKAGSASAASGAVGLSAIYFQGRNCHPDSAFAGPEDVIFRHPWLRRINPRDNPTFHDSWVRQVPFDQIRPELLEDAMNGGSLLLEAYAAGVWGSRGRATFILEAGGPGALTEGSVRRPARHHETREEIRCQRRRSLEPG